MKGQSTALENRILGIDNRKRKSISNDSDPSIRSHEHQGTKRRLFTSTGYSNAVISLTAGYWHTCAMLSGGVIMCWGANAGGQLGIGTNIDSYNPRLVDLGKGHSRDSS